MSFGWQSPKFRARCSSYHASCVCITGFENQKGILDTVNWEDSSTAWRWPKDQSRLILSLMRL